MALLFVGGIMNLAWIAGIALLVLIEKTLPWGGWMGRATGVVLVAWGAARAGDGRVTAISANIGAS